MFFMVSCTEVDSVHANHLPREYALQVSRMPMYVAGDLQKPQHRGLIMP